MSPVELGLEIARTLRSLYPEAWHVDEYQRLLADATVWQAISAGRPLSEIQACYQAELAEILRRRTQFLLY